MRRVVRETPLGRVVVEYEDGQMRVRVEPKTDPREQQPEAEAVDLKDTHRVVH